MIPTIDAKRGGLRRVPPVVKMVTRIQSQNHGIGCSGEGSLFSRGMRWRDWIVTMRPKY